MLNIYQLFFLDIQANVYIKYFRKTREIMFLKIYTHYIYQTQHSFIHVFKKVLAALIFLLHGT